MEGSGNNGNHNQHNRLGAIANGVGSFFRNLVTNNGSNHRRSSSSQTMSNNDDSSSAPRSDPPSSSPVPAASSSSSPLPPSSSQPSETTTSWPAMEEHEHDSDTDDSMPDLQSLSNSSDEEGMDDDAEDFDAYEEDERRAVQSALDPSLNAESSQSSFGGTTHPHAAAHTSGSPGLSTPLRRARVDEDHDEERDRRHPMYRTSTPSNSTPNAHSTSAASPSHSSQSQSHPSSSASSPPPPRVGNNNPADGNWRSSPPTLHPGANYGMPPFFPPHQRPNRNPQAGPLPPPLPGMTMLPGGFAVNLTFGPDGPAPMHGPMPAHPNPIPGNQPHGRAPPPPGRPVGNPFPNRGDPAEVQVFERLNQVLQSMAQARNPHAPNNNNANANTPHRHPHPPAANPADAPNTGAQPGEGGDQLPRPQDPLSNVISDILTRLGLPVDGVTWGDAGAPADGAGGVPGGFPPFGGLFNAFGPGGLFAMPEREDPERARLLVDALDEVPVGLVKRLENVGRGVQGEAGGEGMGVGDGGCAICWDRLLPDEEETQTTTASADKASATVDAASSGTGEQDTSSSSSSSPTKETSSQPQPSEISPNKIVTLPCAHIFHAACLIPWFTRPKQTTCPTCRFNLDPEGLTEGYGARLRRERERNEQAQRPQPQNQTQTPGQGPQGQQGQTNGWQQPGMRWERPRRRDEPAQPQQQHQQQQAQQGGQTQSLVDEQEQGQIIQSNLPLGLDGPAPPPQPSGPTPMPLSIPMTMTMPHTDVPVSETVAAIMDRARSNADNAASSTANSNPAGNSGAQAANMNAAAPHRIHADDRLNRLALAAQASPNSSREYFDYMLALSGTGLAPFTDVPGSGASGVNIAQGLPTRNLWDLAASDSDRPMRPLPRTGQRTTSGSGPEEAGSSESSSDGRRSRSLPPAGGAPTPLFDPRPTSQEEADAQGQGARQGAPMPMLFHPFMMPPPPGPGQAPGGPGAGNANADGAGNDGMVDGPQGFISFGFDVLFGPPPFPQDQQQGPHGAPPQGPAHPQAGDVDMTDATANLNANNGGGHHHHHHHDGQDDDGDMDMSMDMDILLAIDADGSVRPIAAHPFNIQQHRRDGPAGPVPPPQQGGQQQPMHGAAPQQHPPPPQPSMMGAGNSSGTNLPLPTGNPGHPNPNVTLPGFAEMFSNLPQRGPAGNVNAGPGANVGGNARPANLPHGPHGQPTPPAPPHNPAHPHPPNANIHNPPPHNANHPGPGTGNHPEIDAFLGLLMRPFVEGLMNISLDQQQAQAQAQGQAQPGPQQQPAAHAPHPQPAPQQQQQRPPAVPQGQRSRTPSGNIVLQGGVITGGTQDRISRAFQDLHTFQNMGPPRPPPGAGMPINITIGPDANGNARIPPQGTPAFDLFFNHGAQPNPAGAHPTPPPPPPAGAAARPAGTPPAGTSAAGPTPQRHFPHPLPPFAFGPPPPPPTQGRRTGPTPPPAPQPPRPPQLGVFINATDMLQPFAPININMGDYQHRPPRGERKAWTIPAAPGPSLRQRVERLEREAGMRCWDVSCGIGPSDEEPVMTTTGLVRQIAVRPKASSSEDGGSGKGKEKPVCEHTFHPACLVTAERVAWKANEEETIDGDVDVTCPVCRTKGVVSRQDWIEGANA